MNPSDIESLAQIIDKNAAFKRPEGQLTGYTLDAKQQEQPLSQQGDEEESAKKSAPSNLPLPSTVVDIQIGLPVPSQSKIVQQKNKEEAQKKLPRGNEIWTQHELAAIYERDKQRGLMLFPDLKQNGEQVKEVALGEAIPENSVEPSYNVLFEQKVNAEDVYLGLDGPSESEAVVVKVELPEVESASQIAMRVEPYNLLLRANAYYLNAALPRRVVEGKGNATWDSKLKVLHVRLTLDPQ